MYYDFVSIWIQFFWWPCFQWRTRNDASNGEDRDDDLPLQVILIRKGQWIGVCSGIRVLISTCCMSFPSKRSTVWKSSWPFKPSCLLAVRNLLIFSICRKGASLVLIIEMLPGRNLFISLQVDYD